MVPKVKFKLNKELDKRMLPKFINILNPSKNLGRLNPKTHL
jgi:hypothetical protein